MAKKLNGVNMQTRLESFIEANVNTFVGFLVSWITAYFVLPLFGMKKSVVSSFEITVIFTFLSIARNYIIRRIFNGKEKGTKRKSG